MAPSRLPPTGTITVSLALAGCLLITGCGSNPSPTEPAKQAVVPADVSTTAVHQSPPPSNVAPSTTAGATQACSLITEQEAAAALGSDPGPGQPTALDGTASACSFIAGHSALQLSLTPSGGKATYDQEHAHMPSSPAGALFDISGIGDSAFGQAKGSRAAINFDKGDALVVIGLDLAGATQPPRDQVKALASSAAARA